MQADAGCAISYRLKYYRGEVYDVVEKYEDW
jgi:hypothetical protein